MIVVLLTLLLQSVIIIQDVFEQNAYVGIYVFEDRCWGGTQTMNNSYCNGEIVSAFLGCTDESALNYNSNANQDDGSCYFENNSDLCVGNPIEGMSLAVWDPVCGCDGFTYSNSGDAACRVFMILQVVSVLIFLITLVLVFQFYCLRVGI